VRENFDVDMPGEVVGTQWGTVCAGLVCSVRAWRREKHCCFEPSHL